MVKVNNAGRLRYPQLLEPGQPTGKAQQSTQVQQPVDVPEVEPLDESQEPSLQPKMVPEQFKDGYDGIKGTDALRADQQVGNADPARQAELRAQDAKGPMSQLDLLRQINADQAGPQQAASPTLPQQYQDGYDKADAAQLRKGIDNNPDPVAGGDDPSQRTPASARGGKLPKIDEQTALEEQNQLDAERSVQEQRDFEKKVQELEENYDHVFRDGNNVLAIDFGGASEREIIENMTNWLGGEKDGFFLDKLLDGKANSLLDGLRGGIGGSRNSEEAAKQALRELEAKVRELMKLSGEE